MKVKNTTIKLRTEEGIDFVKLTEQINSLIKQSKISNGIVNVFVKHTTAGLRINENEERLLKDINCFLENFVAKDLKCLHDDIHLRDCPADERINGHSHLRSLLLNTTESIPIVEGAMTLGEWQDVFFIELDGARDREVSVHIMGE